MPVQAPAPPVSIRPDLRVLVTGGRNWPSVPRVLEALDQVLAEHLADLKGTGQEGNWSITVIHGDCRSGADAIAKLWVRKRAPLWHYRIRQKARAADWRPGGVFNDQAGFERNSTIVSWLRPGDRALAFAMPCRYPRCRWRPGPHDTHGTTDCAEKAARAGINPLRIGYHDR